MLRGSTPSVMSRELGHFSRSPQAHIPRSKFDRSHGHKTTFDAGYLVPILVDEVLPGDTFSLKMTAFSRIATLLTPIMDNLHFESFFFFVPNRLVWTNWERFNGSQDNPTDSTDYSVPYMESPNTTGWTEGSLADYFGIPTDITGVFATALQFRAYNLIWNQWFRDENLQDSVPVPMDDGPDTASNYVVLQRGKRYDYFTSCLPFPQKGPAVPLPLGSTAPVISNQGFSGGTGIPGFNVGTPSVATGIQNVSGGTGAVWSNPALSGSTAAVATWNDPALIVDLSDATASTVNDIRLAFQTQKLYERDARGGTRYTEIIRSHFGVISPDMRLQRAEYLGGGYSPVVINPIAQTSSTASQPTPQANLAAYGTVAARDHGFVKSFTEHGTIIGLICVRADLNYQQGLNRMWSRSTRFDFYWPALAHIGEQAVYNQEIYAVGGNASPNTDLGVFGYQERFAEYRYKPSLITGQFRSTYSTPLDMWHLAQKFTALPTLGPDFIVENPPIDRVKSLSSSYPDFLLDTFFHYHCARPMPVYSVPGLIDHF